MSQQRTMETLEDSELSDPVNALVDRVARNQARVVVERSGLPVAALVSVADLDQLTRLDAERDARFARLDQISDAFADIPLEELEREAARALAEVRAQNRLSRREGTSPE